MFCWPLLQIWKNVHKTIHFEFDIFAALKLKWSVWHSRSIFIGNYNPWVWNFSVIKYPTNLCFLVNCPYVLFLKCLLNDKGMKDLASETSFTSRINLKLRSGFVRHESYRHFFTNLNEIGEGATFDETLIWWIRWKDYLNHLPIWGDCYDHEICLLFNEMTSTPTILYFHYY